MDNIDDNTNNASSNLHLREVSGPSRRRVVHFGLAFAGAALAHACETMTPVDMNPGTTPNPSNDAGTSIPDAGLPPDAGPMPQPMSFRPVPVSTQDALVVSEDYLSQVVFAWGDPINGQMPPFKGDASDSASDQAKQAGMHHDGMHFFPLPLGSQASDRGLLVVNHEYVDQGLLFQNGYAFDEVNPLSAELIQKSQNAHGVSVVELTLQGDQWKVVPSSFARRITANTPMEISGPAAGAALMKTSADPTGKAVQGTLNNCAHGYTPWGTYLTCEENFNGYFSTKTPTGFVQTPLMKRYGVADTGKDLPPGRNGNALGLGWFLSEKRFQVDVEPNESNRFGWVVEIDPFEPTSTPVKRTALGRFKHEGATVTLSKDGYAVVYMGDDQANEYIYKFVSAKKYDANNRAANKTLLDEGTLFAAQFSPQGIGSWVELTFGKNGLIAPAFESQADIVIRARDAADTVKATKMDRPEWIAVHPKTNEVYVTLTNNSSRAAGDGAANPRINNRFGQIVRFKEAADDAAAQSFQWELFVLGGNPAKAEDSSKGQYQGNIDGDAFGSPDGLWIDDNGLLWVQTDVSTSTINSGVYEGMGNNQMLVMDTVTKKSKRIAVGPNQCELTGITATPDMKWLFFNIQHPGESNSELSGTDPTKWPSHWPAGGLSRPRSATVALRRKDKAVVGT